MKFERATVSDNAGQSLVADELGNRRSQLRSEMCPQVEDSCSTHDDENEEDGRKSGGPENQNDGTLLPTVHILAATRRENRNRTSGRTTDNHKRIITTTAGCCAGLPER